MRFEHLWGRRIVPYLLALFHLSVTEWPYTPPLLNPEEDGPSLRFYSSLPTC